MGSGGELIGGHAHTWGVERAVLTPRARSAAETTMNPLQHDREAREDLALSHEIPIDEDAAVIAAELLPVAVFMGWRWREVRPDREITAEAA